ncbi:MAG: hypothetical protein IT204_10720 [Fimbriimonadaceae bacterium]|nr:hypothetical protein [Fimbriimonadaceae bacterium]
MKPILMHAALTLAALVVTACAQQGEQPVARRGQAPPVPLPPATPAAQPVQGGGQPAKPAAKTIFGHQQASLAHLKSLPEAQIGAARQHLQVAYGHTSHGSQIVSGMQGLDAFMGGRGRYAFNATGAGGALRLVDGAGYDEQGGLVGDAGWEAGEKLRFEDETRKFLGSPTAQGRGSKNPGINVVMWSFCGQMSGFDPQRQVKWYLDQMARLDAAYPGVTFVRMTGHLDGSGVAGRLNQNNELVRAACRQGGKWLFDFADIESYDPDGAEYLSRGGNDACGYNGGNWAQEWQSKHREGQDWYRCESAHSEPLNANRKAYAAWAMFAAIAAAKAGG